MATLRTCRHCGKPFEPSKARQVYCTLPCSFAHKKKLAREKYLEKRDAAKAGAVVNTIPCRHCKAEFVPSSPGSRYCSEACRKGRLSQYKREHYQQQRVIEHNKRMVGLPKGCWGLSVCPFESGEIRLMQPGDVGAW